MPIVYFIYNFIGFFTEINGMISSSTSWMVVVLLNFHYAFAPLQLNGLVNFVGKVTIGAGAINLPAIIFYPIFLWIFS